MQIELAHTLAELAKESSWRLNTRSIYLLGDKLVAQQIAKSVLDLHVFQLIGFLAGTTLKNYKSLLIALNGVMLCQIVFV